MPVEATHERDRAVGVTPRAPWRVAEVRVMANYRLAVAFVDGSCGIVDLARMIVGPSAGIFSTIARPAVFARARVELGAVTWPNGVDLDPDALYEQISRDGLWLAAE